MFALQQLIHFHSHFHASYYSNSFKCSIFPARVVQLRRFFFNCSIFCPAKFGASSYITKAKAKHRRLIHNTCAYQLLLLLLLLKVTFSVLYVDIM